MDKCVCTDESSVLLAENNHIPETKASHRLSPANTSKQAKSDVDMVKADQRDFIFKSECSKKSFHYIFTSQDMDLSKETFIY